MKRLIRIALIVAVFLAIVYGVTQFMRLVGDIRDPRTGQYWQWARGSESTRADLVTVQRDACPGAPFILPADGFIGLLYADSRSPYSASSPHQGIDIFSNAEPGVVPVYAAYDGYISRESNWRSALIQRIPEDPLEPGRQIWLYYAHMADREGNSFIIPAFPPGTDELFIEQGTLLGYTGDYNGGSLRSVWVHLHFSIIQDDSRGRYTNELEFANTIDPSPYLGLPVHYACGGTLMECNANPVCLD